MFAIISDIHSNLEALTGVFGRIDAEKVDEVLCLGDVVGYGPDPEACIDIIRERCRFTIRGNHDDALIGSANDFNIYAREVIEGTRQLMRPGLFSSLAKRERWTFIRSLEPARREGRVLYVHGSPRDPVKEYVMRTDVVFAPDKLKDIFSRIDHLCFVGHTHQPGVFIEKNDAGRVYFEHVSPSEMPDATWTVTPERALINVGSVGQPRDGDNRACFVFVEEDGEGRPLKVRFQRIEYDLRVTIKKIEGISWIDPLCGTRLEIGK